MIRSKFVSKLSNKRIIFRRVMKITHQIVLPVLCFTEINLVHKTVKLFNDFTELIIKQSILGEHND